MPTLSGDRLLVRSDVRMPGADNMRIDLEMLRTVAEDGVAGGIRFYGFAPACLTLGRFQDAAEVDRDACRRDGVDVVQRPTGGRAILHDDEVTYAVACRTDDPDFGGDVLTSCGRIHDAVARGLRHLGVMTQPVARHSDERSEAKRRAAVADCFARPASHELVDCDGNKLVGSAQARRGDALLQHGSVLLAPPRAADYFVAADGAAASRVGAPTRGARALVGGSLTFEQLRAALEAGFREHLRDRTVGADA